MGLSSQKQRAIDGLVRKAIGKQAVVKFLGGRYGSTKWSNYQHYLLDSGHTVFVNLDCSPITAHVSEQINRAHFRKYQNAQARAERKLARKAEMEQVKAQAKKVKAKKPTKTVKKRMRDVETAVLNRMAAAERPANVVAYDPKLQTVEP
jgi:hypothetical protein